MHLELRHGLIFVDAEVEYRGKSIVLSDVIVDTGSLGTLFSADYLEAIGVIAESGDPVLQIVGVGGIELVYVKQIDAVRLGKGPDQLVVRNFNVEVGAMEYDFPINGIVGMDFLRAVGAVIDLATFTMQGTVSNSRPNAI